MRLLPPLTLLILLALPLPASADLWSSKFDETLDFSVHGRSGRIDLARLHPDLDRERIESGAPRRTRRTLGGSTLRANVSLSGLRTGIGIGAYRVVGPVAEASLGLDTGLLGFSGEAFAGYAHGRDVRPYVELRAVCNSLTGTLRDPGGDIFRDATSRTLSIGFRGGVLFAINEYFFLDLSVEHGAGEESAFSAGLGIPIPFANL